MSKNKSDARDIQHTGKTPPLKIPLSFEDALDGLLSIPSRDIPKTAAEAKEKAVKKSAKRYREA